MIKLFYIIIFLIGIQLNNFDEHCIHQKFDFVDLDNLGNVYIVKNDQVKKYNNKGALIKIFSNKRLGSISSIDVSNPLRILLFYKDQSSILFLDSQLSEQNDKIDLNQINLEQSALACTSINNSVWLFNKQNCELIRLDKSRFINTGNLNNLLSLELNPVFMLEYNNFLYLSDPLIGILIFDIFGTYYKTLPIKSVNKFNIVAGKIYYLKDNKLFAYDLKKYENEVFEILPDNLSSIVHTDNFQLKLYNDSICISKKNE